MNRFLQMGGLILQRLLEAMTLLFLALLLSFFLLPKIGFPFETVLSGSMEPYIGTEDLLLINSYDREPNTGDVIVFRHGGIRIIHRVVRRSGAGYRTKGDANASPDAFLVTPDMIEGACITVIRNGKRFSDFLKTPQFFICGAALCLLQGFGGGRTRRKQGKNIIK